MIRAARAAGDRLKQDFAEIATLEIKHKNGPADPFYDRRRARRADRQGDPRRGVPDYGFLGEEGGVVPGVDASHTWIAIRWTARPTS